jgi:hypothetical protein
MARHNNPFDLGKCLLFLNKLFPFPPMPSIKCAGLQGAGAIWRTYAMGPKQVMSPLEFQALDLEVEENRGPQDVGKVVASPMDTCSAFGAVKIFFRV